MLSDVDENGCPLQVVPGSHQRDALPHNASGVFCGAVDPSLPEAKLETAVTLTGKAGDMSVYTGLNQAEFWQQMQANMIYGEQTLRPRLADVPVLMPLPPPPDATSLFKVQQSGGAVDAFSQEALIPTLGD